jgi:indolepyruvate ferredoxin oxidoreductase
VFHGDIGCYSLLKYKPFDRLMHNLSGMGLGGGTGAGIDPFIRNKQLVFMGDSTFFHSGMTAISDSIKHDQDITYIILDNKTTAMTGHQPTPGVDIDILGRPTFAQDIESVVRGMAGEQDGPVSIVRMNPAEREAYRESVEKALLKDGVKIVIADKECGITFNRRQRNEERTEIQATGYLAEEKHINITPEVCEYCLECTRATGCSGLTVEDSLHGPKVATDLSLCVSDGACTKVTVANGDKSCPSFEEVLINRTQAPEVRTESIELDKIAGPEIEDFDGAWYAYIGGVGGMGVNTISAIISTAGAKEGYTVRFTNKKGLAIRNGAVYSHVIFSKNDRVMSQITPHGHADLLLGLDILEAVRGMDPNGPGRVASPEHTTAVVETGKRETIMTMTGIDDFDTNDLEGWIKRYSRSDRYFGMDLGEISERFLGNKIYANSILLGAAFQRGALPISLENLRWAMKVNIRPGELEPNVKAFEMGRKAAIDPSAFDKPADVVTYSDLVNDKAAILELTRGHVEADLYKALAAQVADWKIPDQAKLQFALGVYDTTQWGGNAYAKRFTDLVSKVYDRDKRDLGFEATAALIPNLARVMAYKDEIYVAQLATSEEKRRRDNWRYNIDPARGDRIRYKHIMRPHFEVFGMDIKFDLSPPVWMLKVMRRLGFLRKMLPTWHTEEKAYRNWYMGIVESFAAEEVTQYAAYVRVFKLPDQVRGYREVIWPKMQAAMQNAEYMLEGKGQLAAIDTYAEPEAVLEQA